MLSCLGQSLREWVTTGLIQPFPLDGLVEVGKKKGKLFNLSSVSSDALYTTISVTQSNTQHNSKNT